MTTVGEMTFNAKASSNCCVFVSAIGASCPSDPALCNSQTSRGFRSARSSNRREVVASKALQSQTKRQNAERLTSNIPNVGEIGSVDTCTTAVGQGRHRFLPR